MAIITWLNHTTIFYQSIQPSIHSLNEHFGHGRAYPRSLQIAAYPRIQTAGNTTPVIHTVYELRVFNDTVSGSLLICRLCSFLSITCVYMPCPAHSLVLQHFTWLSEMEVYLKKNVSFFAICSRPSCLFITLRRHKFPQTYKTCTTCTKKADILRYMI